MFCFAFSKCNIENVLAVYGKLRLQSKFYVPRQVVASASIIVVGSHDVDLFVLAAGNRG